ncbi:MAG: Mov34/MPN/PAD-1 family protein [Thermoplasmata archaeon]|nr:Mov34/MPN/PAD-1 family protein [Thermoplasmata archaeon]
MDIIRHTLRFTVHVKESLEVRGVLTGTRDSERIKVLGAMPISHTDELESPLDEEFFEKVEKYQNKNDVEIMGWYHSHPNRSPSFTQKDRLNHHAFLSRFSDTIALIIDPLMIGTGVPFTHLMRVFTLSYPEMGGKSPAMELDKIKVRAEFGGVVKSLVEMVELSKRRQPPILEFGEDSDITKTRRVKKVENGRQGEGSSNLKAIESFSSMVLKEKVQLARIKKGMDSRKGLDVTRLTKEMRTLKISQISLSEKIDHRIHRTTDVQAKIALCRIRDSLTRDMRRLEALIDEQYISTLAELTRM